MEMGTYEYGPNDISLRDILEVANYRKARIALGALTCGFIALAISFAIPPTFTARASLLPPQQQQNAATLALSQLGSLAGLGSLSGGGRSATDQYVAMLESRTVLSRIVDKFNLQKVYENDLREEALQELSDNSNVAIGKKDGVISIEVDDKDPKRAADIANEFIDQLKELSKTLAISEAQSRRAFFEDQLNQSKENLKTAQIELQKSGISEGSLKAEPKAIAEGYIQLRAEISATEATIKSMRQMLTDSAPELRLLESKLTSLKQQLARSEKKSETAGESDYISKYRDFKYHETIFEMFARQYELARVDESREGMLIQVLDEAIPPERKSKPKKGQIAVLTTLLAGLLLFGYFVIHDKILKPARSGK